MATMRLMLSEVDLHAGEVTYAPGGTLGPRSQHDIQLVLIHAGSARIAVDDGPPALARRRLGPAPAPRAPRGVRVRRGAAHPPQLGPGPARPIPACCRASPRSRRSCRARPSWATPCGAAVAAARSPLPTARPLAAALGGAALWRYAGEAEAGDARAATWSSAPGRVLHARLGDPALDLGAGRTRGPRDARAPRPQLPQHSWASRRWPTCGAGGSPPASSSSPGPACRWGRSPRAGGFKTVHHFSRRVRAAAGMPPTELRRARWGAQRS